MARWGGGGELEIRLGLSLAKIVLPFMPDIVEIIVLPNLFQIWGNCLVLTMLYIECNIFLFREIMDQ